MVKNVWLCRSATNGDGGKVITDGPTLQHRVAAGD